MLIVVDNPRVLQFLAVMESSWSIRAFTVYSYKEYDVRRCESISKGIITGGVTHVVGRRVYGPLAWRQPIHRTFKPIFLLPAFSTVKVCCYSEKAGAVNNPVSSIWRVLRETTHLPSLVCVSRIALTCIHLEWICFDSTVLRLYRSCILRLSPHFTTKVVLLASLFWVLE